MKRATTIDGHGKLAPVLAPVLAVMAAVLLGGVGTGCQSAAVADDSDAHGHGHSHPHGKPATASTSADLATQLQALNDAGTKALEAGRLSEAAARFAILLQLDPENALALYKMARVAARQGRRADAVNYLTHAIDAGFIDFDRMRYDSDLSSLRNFGPYEALMAKGDLYLREQAERRVAALRDQLGPEYLYRVDFEHRMIFATHRGQDVLDSVTAMLAEYAEAQWDALFDNRFEGFLTVVIPHEDFFRSIVPDTRIGGFYHPERRLLLTMDIGYTLTHEFTHALHFDDLNRRQVAHRIWFLEGLATCFENSNVIAGEVIALPNERQFLAQHLLITGQLDPWAKLLRMDQTEFMERAPERYAQVRYIVFWLWQQGQLRAFYDKYCQTSRIDRSGVRALEETLQRPLDELEAEWRQWLAELPPFQGFTGPTGPVLGVQLEPVADGLQIRGLVPGGPAAMAGILPGDVLLEIESRRIFTVEMLVNELARYAVGDTITVHVTRAGASVRVPVKLASRGGD